MTTSLPADTELIGDVDVALVPEDVRILNLFDDVIVALPRRPAEGTGNLVPGALPLGGSPHLETFLVHVLAALCAAIDRVVGASKGDEADGAIAFDGLAFVIFLGFTAGGGMVDADLDGRGVGEDLTKLRREQSELVDEVKAGAEDSRHNVDDMLALVPLLRMRTGARGNAGDVDVVDVAGSSGHLDRLLGAFGGAGPRPAQYVEPLRYCAVVDDLKVGRRLGAESLDALFLGWGFPALYGALFAFPVGCAVVYSGLVRISTLDRCGELCASPSASA